VSAFFLIRHARASASEAEYDQLQADGVEQARLLGEHFGAAGQQFDVVYVGPHDRQFQTLQIARAAAGAVGAGWPEPIMVEGLAEAPYEVLIKNHLVPRLAEDPHLMALANALGSAAETHARDAAMRAIWDYMVVLWQSGALAGADLESIEAFDARVDQAFGSMRARAHDGQSIMVMTSNGVIGRILSAAARTAPPQGEATHKLYNSSVSIIEVEGDSVALRKANLIDHLRDPALLTIL
jgi:broad specificity phosphatase PhoE